jgi:hypothetical protein
MKLKDLALQADGELKRQMKLSETLRPAFDVACFKSPGIEAMAQITAGRSALAGHEDLIRQMRGPFEHLRIAQEDMVRSVQLTTEMNGASRAFAKLVEEQRTISRAFHGPIEDLRHQFSVLSSIAEMSKVVESGFRLPLVSETPRLAQVMRETVQFVRESQDLQMRTISETIGQMRKPWLSIQDEMASLRGLAGLHDIGRLVCDASSFGDRVTEQLRNRLGDWREETALPSGFFDDLELRASFYQARGFDPSLTDFPHEAFQEGVRAAELDEDVPRVIEVVAYEIPAISPEEEVGFVRTNAAHDRLMRFEVHLRRFIDSRMTAEFGADWIRHQVPGDIRKEWLEKQGKSAAHGEPPRPLFAFSDFTDYEAIASRNDNWKRVFAAIFHSKESMQESFHRLYPVRLGTMHGRLITQDDELTMLVEVKRILRAIGVLPSH